jgi:hypothetical protein
VLINLELAKRLLLTARAAAPNQDEPPESESPDAPHPQPVGPDHRSASSTGRDPGQTFSPADGQPQGQAKADPGAAPRPTDRRPPGKGDLPPLPDDDVLAQLTPEDAQAHLERAADRIAADRQARLRQTAPPPSQRYPEW